MVRFPKLQGFLQHQFNNQKMNDQIRTLPTEFTDKNTGEVRTNRAASKSMNIPSKLVNLLEQAIEVHKENGDYLTIQDGTKTLNAIKVIDKRTVVLTDRRTGELIEREYPASLILAPQLEQYVDPEIDEEFIDQIADELNIKTKVEKESEESENY
jgi:hypothetical protein